MTTSTGTIRYVHILLQTLRHLGFQRSTFLNGLDMPIDFMDGSKLRLPLEQIAEIWRQGAIASNEPALSLIAGKYIHPGDFGVMAHVWMNCQNIGDAYQLKSDFDELMNTALKSSIEYKNDDTVHYVADIINGDKHTRETLIELDFAAILPVGKALVAKEHREHITLLEVNFKHSPRTDLEVYQSVFNCPVNFNQPENKVIVNKNVLTFRTYSPDPDLKSALINTVHNIMAKTLKNDSMSSQVASLISESITKKASLNQEDIANKLRISTATLKRRIKEEGLSFSQINKQVKMDLAKEMIRSGSLSYDQIAYTLNYSDNSAFHRAFKNWTGMTVAHYSKQMHD